MILFFGGRRFGPMATVRHTVPDTTDAFEVFFCFALLFMSDTREVYVLGWSLAGLAGCSMVGRILVVHTWR